MRDYLVTIENDRGEVWEGLLRTDTLEINDYVRIRLHSKAPQYQNGVVIMFQENE